VDERLNENRYPLHSELREIQQLIVTINAVLARRKTFTGKARSGIIGVQSQE
jgi:hypothetical protein